ncbi:MAG TPA: hypothetical protein VFH42_08085 [Sporolactobacillaceae bacterium]|nr:hypothetical protein [Sporolactobacillaceae bacterium]
MLKEPVVATMLLLALIAFGEFVSIKTRARVPMLLIVLMGYLVLLWLKIMPQDLVSNSTMSIVGGVLVAPLIVHMGTIIPLKIIRQQWRSVIIALLGIIISTAVILLVVSPIFGYKIAASGVGPLAGGIIAYVVTSTKLKALGLTALVAIPALVLSLQSLIGLPLSAFFLRRYAQKLKANIGPIDQIAATLDPMIEEPVRKSWIPDKYATQTILLFQLFIGGALAIILGKVTGINYSIWALVIGIVGTLTGFYRDKMLERANSFGIAMLGVIFVIIPSMNGVTFSLFIQNLPAVLAILVIGAIGIILGGLIGGKLLGWDINKSIPVALTAMFGFPGDFLVSEEVSRSVGETKEEQEYLFKEILSPMIVGGFTTVTIASIVIASIIMNTIH